MNNIWKVEGSRDIGIYIYIYIHIYTYICMQNFGLSVDLLVVREEWQNNEGNGRPCPQCSILMWMILGLLNRSTAPFPSGLRHCVIIGLKAQAETL